jgi:NAD(P)-dependent dehydrogenase (short-subunit alcohol dehydrogenase family)
MKWTTADMPDQTGRTVVITGASAGIGLVAARELAVAGARVVAAVRNVTKAHEVLSSVRGTIEIRELDLSSLESVRRFAEDWTGDLDVLINNAGIMQVPLSRTADGFEIQIATNYLGPFALTNLLLPYLTDRVVSLTSQLHRIAKLDVSDLNWDTRDYDELSAYCDSKMADLLFTIELQRYFDASCSHLRSIAAHPGIATTSLAAHAGGFAGSVNRFRFLLNDAERGALPTLYAATQDIPGGSYVGPGGPLGIKGHPKIGRPSGKAFDIHLARDLWRTSESLTGTQLSAGS